MRRAAEMACEATRVAHVGKGLHHLFVIMPFIEVLYRYQILVPDNMAVGEQPLAGRYVDLPVEGAS